jgi:hypothetical protein
VRHARGVVVRDFDVAAAAPDARPTVVLDDVVGARFDGLRSIGSSGHLFQLRQVAEFLARACGSLGDTSIARAEDRQL